MVIKSYPLEKFQDKKLRIRKVYRLRSKANIQLADGMVRALCSIIHTFEEAMDHKMGACNIHSCSLSTKPSRTKEIEQPYRDFSHHTTLFGHWSGIGPLNLMCSNG